MAMKLIVLGATGGTGLEILTQAVERGHSVTAFVRSPECLRPFGGRIAIMQGNPLDSDEMTQAIQGQEAVLSAFGPRVPLAKTDHDLLGRFAGALTTATAGGCGFVRKSLSELMQETDAIP